MINRRTLFLAALSLAATAGTALPTIMATTGLDMAGMYSAASCSLVPPTSDNITTASVSGSASKACKYSTGLRPSTASPPM